MSERKKKQKACSKETPLAERLLEVEQEGLDEDVFELDFGDEPIGDAGVKQIVKGLESNSALKRLKLQRCDLTPDGFAHLGELLYAGGRIAQRREAEKIASIASMRQEGQNGGYGENIECLVLAGNYCGESGPGKVFCDGLPMAVNLISLSLAGCSLGDSGISYLFEILAARGDAERLASNLVNLDISHNYLGPLAARELVRVLGCNVGLRSLDLQANEFGEEGAAALADCIKTNKGRLRKFNVSQNALGLEGVRMLLDQFVSPNIFTIHVVRSPGHAAGATLGSDMKVAGIGLNSAIEKWNQTCFAEGVCVGDYVVRVNDKTEAEQILEEIAGERVLEIVLHRPGASLMHLDVTYNNITLDGVADLRDEVGKPAGRTMASGILEFFGGRQVFMNAA